MGAQSEDAAKFNRASALYFHLFGYEVLNSVVLLREGELHVLARAEKGHELDRVLGKESPVLSKDDTDPPLQLKVHTWDSAASVQPLVLAAAAAGPTMGVLRSGGSSSASSSGGALLRAWDSAVSVQGLILVDVTRAVGAALALKDDDAIVRTAAAGRVACRALCDGVTRLVEAAFDADRDERATHDALAQQIDALMCDALAPHCARAVPKLRDVNDAAAKRCANAASVACANATTTRSTRLVESCYFPIVTSGGACTTDAGAASDADAINDDVVVVEFGARFASYCTNVARTFFVEPLPSLEKCYAALRGVHTACVDAMREHAPLSAVAAAAHDYLDNNDAGHLAKFLPRHNFGFALGLDFRDDDLVLTRSNARTFESRMIFNVAIGLHGVPLDAAERRKARGAIRDLKKVSMLIADTVLVQSGGAAPVVLTDFSPTRPALKDWRDVSNLATSQRERAAALAAQRAAAAEAELLAQLDAEAAANVSSKKAPVPGVKTKKTKNKKDKNAGQTTTPVDTATPAAAATTKDTPKVVPATTTPAVVPEKDEPPPEVTSKPRHRRQMDEVPSDDDGKDPEETTVTKLDDDDPAEEDEETEAEAAQLLERVRAAGRSRWCESCEAAVKDARDFLSAPSQQSSSKSVAALERATSDLAESMAAWRIIERALEQAKSADALRGALNKASAAGFPAKATAVKRARRRLKEIEAVPDGTPPVASPPPETPQSQQQQLYSTNQTTLERETNAQIQLGMAASHQAFHEVASNKRTNKGDKERPPKPVDELAKYFHGDEHEIAQLREQKIDLTKLVLLAGRGAPKLAPWRDSHPPHNAVAVGRVLGLLGRLAPRVFVNLNAAERSGLLLRGGAPPREWLALANDPTEAAGREAEEAAIKHNLDDETMTNVGLGVLRQQMPMPPKLGGLEKAGGLLKPPRAWGMPSMEEAMAPSPAHELGALFGEKKNGEYPAPAAPPRRTYSTEAFVATTGLPKPSRDPYPPPGVRRIESPPGNNLVQSSLDWSPLESPAMPQQPQPPRPSSSWDATPDSFGATRDEISAMAGAAYAAALGFGFSPQPEAQQEPTKRVVASSFETTAPPPGVFAAAPRRPLHQQKQDDQPSGLMLGMHQFRLSSEPSPIGIVDEPPTLGSPFDDLPSLQRRRKNDDDDFFDDQFPQYPPLQPPPGVVAPRHRRINNDFPPGVPTDNRFFSSSVD